MSSVQSDDGELLELAMIEGSDITLFDDVPTSKTVKRRFLDYFAHNYLKIFKILSLIILILLFLVVVLMVNLFVLQHSEAVPDGKENIPDRSPADKIPCNKIRCYNESCSPSTFSYIAAKHLSCCNCMPKYKLLRYEYDLNTKIHALVLEPLFDIDVTSRLDIQQLEPLCVEGEWHTIQDSDKRYLLKYFVQLESHIYGTHDDTT